jgi:hypothetical protein
MYTIVNLRYSLEDYFWRAMVQKDGKNRLMLIYQCPHNDGNNTPKIGDSVKFFKT